MFFVVSFSRTNNIGSRYQALIEASTWVSNHPAISIFEVPHFDALHIYYIGLLLNMTRLKYYPMTTSCDGFAKESRNETHGLLQVTIKRF